jgi:hypothetical protein
MSVSLTRLLLTILLGMSVFASPAVAQGPVLLTVAGAVSISNRGPADPFRDAFVHFHERSFKRAHTFDRAALEALPQETLRAHAEGWPRAVTARGPRLSDLLAAAGVDAAANVTLVALDGYAITLDASQRSEAEWILAITLDDMPLGLGGRGPAWLLQDTGASLASAEQEALWIWSVFLIEVE